MAKVKNKKVKQAAYNFMVSYNLLGAFMIRISNIKIYEDICDEKILDYIIKKFKLDKDKILSCSLSVKKVFW